MVTAAVALIGRCRSVNRMDESGNEKKERHGAGQTNIEKQTERLNDDKDWGGSEELRVRWPLIFSGGGMVEFSQETCKVRRG